MEKWWHLYKEDVAGKLMTDINQGLVSAEIPNRQAQYGLNQLAEKPGRSPIGLFLDQFKNFIIWVLIAAALISGFLQEWVDALAILCIVIINAILGFIQEYRAEKSLAALKKMSSPNSKVIRNGQQQIVPSEEIVPGDLIDLEAPADRREIQPGIVRGPGDLEEAGVVLDEKRYVVSASEPETPQQLRATV